ncbi:COG1470 family protein [Streptomyces scopuliridis]|uniref:COG1470 family protein n=1 Tax=Streptomyces scopuliridis TaxID=452529 RepID=UPI0035E292E0
MSLTASLDASSVTAEPGAQTDVPLQVLNSGSTVEEYRFEVVGACAAWSTVEPRTLSLYPGASGTVLLRLTPPRDSSVPAGETPFGIRVVPTSELSETVVPEGRVTVAPFTEVTSELVPRSSNGARRGNHQLAVDNRGNAPVTVRLSGRTGTERARVDFATAELRIPPGHADFAKLRVRPAKRLWRGTPVTHTFQVFAAPVAAEGHRETYAPGATGPAGLEPAGTEPAGLGPAGLEPVVLDGSYEQQAILPGWLPRALILAAVVAIALVGLWYALLRPAVKSAAREAITPEAVASAAAKTASPSGGTADGGATAGTGGGGGNAGATAGVDGGATSGNGQNGTGSGASSGSGTGAGSAQGAGAPTSARVEVRDAVGGGSATGSAYRVPAGSTFELTDIVVQNPQGDAGTLVVSSQDDPVLRLALENFRDSDYHFVTPILVSAGGEITMTVDCRQVGRPVQAPRPSRCAESLFLGGTLRSNSE